MICEISEATPLTDRVDLARWTMLGHVLRLPENSPAAVALSYALDGCQIYKSRRGRHQTNLFNTIKLDLSVRGFKLECFNDLYVVRDRAKKRTEWKELFCYERFSCTNQNLKNFP